MSTIISSINSLDTITEKALTLLFLYLWYPCPSGLDLGGDAYNSNQYKASISTFLTIGHYKC